MYKERIVVIGAGAAGLTAAHQLKKRGYESITVFEKENHVGGKVCTFALNGSYHDIGAIWTTSDYKTIKRISREVGAHQRRAKQLDTMTENGRVMKAISHTLNGSNLVKLSRAAFNFWRLGQRYPRIKQPGFHGYHPDFFLAMDALSTKHGFLSLTQTMAPTMSACGYGFYEEVPALYWMKLMVLLLKYGLRGGAFFGNLKSFENGFQSLWQKVACDLDVRLGQEVTSMRRFTDGGSDRVEIVTDADSYIFDKVILAAPLEMAYKFVDVSPMERDLFRKIRTLRYVVTVVQSDSDAHVAFVKNIRPARLGHVNAAVKAHPDSGVCVYYQLVDSATSPSQALEILRTDLEEVGISFNQVYLQKIWNYFPHVSQEDLRDGFYEKIESLQGKRGTYYAGSLLSFETVEHTAAYSSDLVERFF